MEDVAIHLHLYLTDKENELTAYKNIKRLRTNGFKILVTSPLPLPEHFYEYIDIFYYDKENQLLEQEYEDIEPTVWWCNVNNVTLNFVVNIVQKHSLAVLRSMIKGCDVASINKIKYIIRFEYDDIFGINSIQELKNVINEIKHNNYDFYLYKNEYPNKKHDISVHLMFYNCEKFLNIFNCITNEQDYNICLDQLGLSKKSLILEQFMLLWLEKNIEKVNIKFNSADIVNTKFADTIFNRHQTSTGIDHGILSDVMRIRVRDQYIDGEVCLAAQNMFSEEPVKVCFSLYGKDESLIDTFTTNLNQDYWYFYKIKTENLKTIKITYSDTDYCKIVDVSNLEDIKPEAIFT